MKLSTCACLSVPTLRIFRRKTLKIQILDSLSQQEIVAFQSI